MNYRDAYYITEIRDYLDEQIMELVETRTGQVSGSPTEWAIAAVKIEALQKVRQHFCREKFPLEEYVRGLV
jgi:hypothetical protein